MEELKYDLKHSKDYKLYKEAWNNFVKCKPIDYLNDNALKILYSYDLYHLKNSPSLNIQMGF